MRQACQRGHPFDEQNTLWWTRDDGRRERRCRTCKRAATRDRQSDGLQSLRTEFLPVEPLMRLAPRFIADEIGHEGHGVKSALNETQQRRYHRAVSAGRITLAAADELSVAFGYHPAEIYGEAWWA